MPVRVSSDGTRVTRGPSPRAPVVIPLWAHFKAGAYALCSAANAQTIEDIYDDNDADITYIQSWECDPELGDESTSRAMWGLANNANDAGGSFLYIRPLSQKVDAIAWNDAGGTIMTGGSSPTDQFEGGPELGQWFDTAASGAGTWRAKMNSDSVEAIDTYAARSSYGGLDYFAPAGLVRGSTPAVFSPLSWVYYTIVVGADLEPISALIAAAEAAAPDQLSKYLEVLGFIIANGFEDDIIFAQAFVQGRGADYGDNATIVGVTDYTLEGVTP